MFTNPNLIYFDRFVFCSIPRFFVCLRMRMSSSQQYANVYVKSKFICPGSIARVPFDSTRRFRPTFLLHTTCVRSCCTWCDSCVAAFKKKNMHKESMMLAFPESLRQGQWCSQERKKVKLQHAATRWRRRMQLAATHQRIDTDILYIYIYTSRSLLIFLLVFQ